jgi:hypothetical protein
VNYAGTHRVRCDYDFHVHRPRGESNEHGKSLQTTVKKIKRNIE